MAERPPAFSRSDRSCILGKRTADVRTKVPEETAEGIRRLAIEAQMTESEFVAEVLMLRVHGEETMRSLALERLAVVAGKGR